MKLVSITSSCIFIYYNTLIVIIYYWIYFNLVSSSYWKNDIARECLSLRLLVRVVLVIIIDRAVQCM